jgi:mRNA interferase MazF
MNSIKRGDVYYIDLSETIGSEQGGIRPCLIVQNDVGNKFSPTTIILPLTAQKKKFKATHVEIDNLLKESTILCEQIRAVDKVRIKGYICTLNEKCMKLVDNKILFSLGITI